MRKYRLPVVIEKDKYGYFASCPALQGCFTQGHSYENVVKNITEAIQAHIEARREKGEPIEIPELVSLTTLEVRA